MFIRKTRVENEKRDKSRFLLTGIAARKIMFGYFFYFHVKADCLLRANHNYCIQCI